MDRGGGNDDYDLADWKKDVLLIQCGVNQPNTVPWSWQFGREYILTVRRGSQVRLPAGMVTVDDDETVRAPARTMWEWYFTIQPAKPKPGDLPFESLCSNSVDSIKNVSFGTNQVTAPSPTNNTRAGRCHSFALRAAPWIKSLRSGDDFEDF